MSRQQDLSGAICVTLGPLSTTLLSTRIGDDAGGSVGRRGEELE